jgi:hypothetical protein
MKQQFVGFSKKLFSKTLFFAIKFTLKPGLRAMIFAENQAV